MGDECKPRLDHLIGGAILCISIGHVYLGTCFNIYITTAPCSNLLPNPRLRCTQGLRINDRAGSKMLQVKEITTDEEFSQIMTVLFNSYNEPYNGFWAIFQGKSEDECGARFIQWHNADPTSHWIYVEDTEQNQIIAATQWNIIEENPHVEPKPPPAAYWIEEGTSSR